MERTDINWCLKDWPKKMKSNFQLCILRKYKNSSYGKGSDSLIKQAALAYGIPREALIDEKVCRSSSGKPFFENMDIHFSISHTEDLWACLIGAANCGLDVQYIRPCNFTKIAGRFFSDREKAYVQKNGIEGFFEIWTRREACSKYTGEGFFGTMPEFVSPDGLIEKQVLIKDNEFILLKEIPGSHIAEGIKCAVCLPEGYEGQIEITDLREVLKEGFEL